jgi:hypothetical protein
MSGRPGRPSLGPRKAKTVRLPVDLYSKLERSRVDAGYAHLNDYIVALLDLAQKLGLNVTLPATQQSLPLFDSRTAAGYEHLNDYIVALLDLAQKLGLNVTPSADQPLPLIDSHTAA